jgi:hypothetical protein
MAEIKTVGSLISASSPMKLLMSMSENLHTITFSFYLGTIEVMLNGRVDVIAKGTYIVKEIRTARNGTGSVLPPVIIKRKNGVWVHVDSEKETEWSLAIGKAIDGSSL